MSLRSRSSCHTSRASPARSQAASASRSSQEPGNWITPKRAATSLGLLELDDLVVLDERIGEQLLAELVEPRRILGLELHQAPHPHVAHPAEPKRRERPFDRLALRIEDAFLRTNQNARFHSTKVATRPASENDAAPAPGPSRRARGPARRRDATARRGRAGPARGAVRSAPGTRPRRPRRR